MAKVRISDYKLANTLSGISGLESRQRVLVESALQIHGRDRGGFEESQVADMLADLVRARLISDIKRQSIIKHLFED